MRTLLAALCLVLVGCGEDDPPAPVRAPSEVRPVLASADLLDGRRLELTSRGRGRDSCLVLSGLDEIDRQCAIAPSVRVPESQRTITAGPIAQRGPRAPLEVYGVTSAAVNDVRVGYSHDGERLATFAPLLYATDAEALRRAGIERPFGFFVAELPAAARRVTATARDRRNDVIARDDYRDFDDLDRSVFIAGKAKPLPVIRVQPSVGRFDEIRVPVEVRRPVGRRDGVSRSYFVSTDSPQPQTGCVTQRAAYVSRGRVGVTVRATLDEADGEGGGSGWCPGPYLGTVVYAASPACPREGPCDSPSPVPSDAALVARFAYEVR